MIRNVAVLRFVLWMVPLVVAVPPVGAYPGIEHAWLGWQSFYVWQDFDPSFYHELTKPTQEQTEDRLNQRMVIKFYLIGLMLPDLLTPEGLEASRKTIEGLYAKRGDLRDPLKIEDATVEQVKAESAFTWGPSSPIPNNNLPALRKMAMYAHDPIHGYSALQKAMIYGAYLHVVQDLHAGCFQYPSLWGSGFVAEPPEAEGLDILSNDEMHHNFFDLTYLPQPQDWEALDVLLFSECIFEQDLRIINHTQLQFYRQWYSAGNPHDYQGWQDLDFPAVQTFVDVAHRYFDVQHLTRERLESYMHGYAISWFMLAGYPGDNTDEAGGVFRHSEWTYQDITNYVKNIGSQYLGFRWWVHLLPTPTQWIVYTIMHVSYDNAFRGFLAELPLALPWPRYFEHQDQVIEWRDAVNALYQAHGDVVPQVLVAAAERIRTYVSYWDAHHLGPNPCVQSRYAGEAGLALELTPEHKKGLEGGPPYLNHVMDVPPHTQTRLLGLKAGLVGAMSGDDTRGRQPGIASLGFSRRGSVSYSTLEVPIEVGGDPNPAQLD